MHRTPKVLATGTVTGLLALGLATAPADAYTRAEKRAEKRQNSAIKKTSRSVTTLRNSTKATTDAIDRVAKSAQADSKRNSDTIGAIVPAVTSALTQLRDGLTAAGNGLGQLRTGLETAGASIRSLATAQEFGVVQAFLGDTALPGQILTSSDIPDDSNPAVLTGKFIVPVPLAAGTAPITLRAAIRSGESDGVEGGNAVGVAGLQSMTVTDATGNVTIGGGSANADNGEVPLTSRPPAAGAPPVYPIAVKAPRVDATPNPFAFPTAANQSIDLTAPSTLQQLGPAPASKFTVAAAGADGLATVDFTVRFHDLTASATDLNE